MRPLARTRVVGLLTAVGLSLALGTAPSLRRSGDPRYLTATRAGAPTDVTPGDGTGLPERRYPYTFAGSDAYYRGPFGLKDPDGPFGLKDAFAHSPLDGLGARAERYPAAVTDRDTYPRAASTTYRLTVVRSADPDS